MSAISRAGAAKSGRTLIDRRAFLIGAGALVAGCSANTGQPPLEPAAFAPMPTVDPFYVDMYGPRPNERFPLPAIDIRQVDPKFLRQLVDYDTPEPVGTIIVDTRDRFLYLVMENGRAMRYGVGVGRQGLSWSGRATIQMKREWPRWTPTQNMMARDPELVQWADGMEPGLTNPLGARALYLFENGRDTLYRLHGTHEPWSIGQAMSSGCIRLFHHDIIDLYERTPIGTRVVVLEHRGPALPIAWTGEEAFADG